MQKIAPIKGAVIIWVLLSVPVLLTLAAFVINLSLSYTALEQAKSYTRLLSLTALEQFYEVLGDTNTGQAQQQNFISSFSDDVKKRVNTIAKENRFTGHKETEFLDFVFHWDEGQGSSGGLLTPGTYYYTTPDNVPGCETAPCFIPADVNALNTDPSTLYGVNAFKIEANYVHGLGMKFFSSFLGDPVKDIKTCSISTAIKRNLMFVVDISGSSAAETHVRRAVPEMIDDPEEGRGGFFAYPLEQVNIPPPQPEVNCYDDDPTEFTQTQYCNWHFIKNYNPSMPPAAGQPHAGPAENRPIGDTNTLKHYYKDFVPFGVEDNYKVTVTGPINDGTYGEVSEYEEADLHPNPSDVNYQSSFLIGKDFFIDRYTKPEPLTSIFNALSVGIDEITDRNIPGDKTGFIFVEKSLIWSRIIKLTKDTSYLSAIAKNSSRNFNGTMYPIRDKYGIFPSGLISEDYTDLYLALNESVTQMKENKAALNGAPSLDGIVYVGDFMPNCVAKKYLPAYKAGCDACGAGDQNCLNTCSERECVNDYNHFAAAVEEIWQLISDEFIPNNITFNVVFLGKDAGPHTMDIEHPDPAMNGRCMTDNEAREYGYDYMKGGNFAGITPSNMTIYYDTKSADKPFYQAGYEAYKLVRATGGLIKSVLQSPPNCVPDNNCVDGTRRLVDRNCNSQKEQLAGYITEIVGTGNPFKIVNTTCDFGQ